MGHLTAAAAVTLLGAAALFPTRAELFDLVQIRAPGPGPWNVVVRSKGGWEAIPLDAFASAAEEEEIIYLRANTLAPRISQKNLAKSLPPGCAGRLVASAADHSEIREGFLCPAPSLANRGQPPERLRLERESFQGPLFSVQYPEGSGFYRDLQLVGAPSPVVSALRVRLRLKALGLFPVERTEKDFRWSGFDLAAGSQVARRRSEAGARALVQHLAPRPQEALLTRAVIDQVVEIAFPPSLLHLAGGIGFENGFEVDESSWALLPGRSEAVHLAFLPRDEPYDWIVLFTPGGTILHWMEPLGEAGRLNPRLYVREGSHGSGEVGYRLKDLKDTWDSAAGPEGSVRLAQHLAVLGGPDWIERRKDLKWVGALARSLSAPAPRWTLALEPL